MKKNIKLITLDLDGTTFTTDKRITQHTKDVIEAAIKQGIHVLPSTGRQLEALPEEFLQIPGVTYAITSNGASVLNLQSKASIHSDLISSKKTADILSYLHTKDVMADIYCHGTCYMDSTLYPRINQYVPESRLAYFQKTRNPIDHLPEYILEHNLDVEKFHLLFQDLELREEIRKELETDSSIYVTNAVSNNLEINSKTANKGAAVLALADYLNIAHDETMAIGDSYNDVDMLKAVGTSVAMGNAPDDIKAFCDIITKTNDDEGVAYAIETYAL